MSKRQANMLGLSCWHVGRRYGFGLKKTFFHVAKVMYTKMILSYEICFS